MDCASLLCMAKLSAQTGRYYEMFAHMKAAAQQKVELGEEERSILSTAFVNVVNPRLAGLRVIYSLEQNNSIEQLDTAQYLRSKIEAELENICHHALEVVDKALIIRTLSDEDKLFYTKMKGDCRRYLAEFQNGDVRKESAAKALEAYSSASSIATSDLPPTHPIRLGLALNFSSFYTKILSARDHACSSKLFIEAMAELNSDFDEWLNVLVEKRNLKAKADQEEKEYNERTVFEAADMVVDFIIERVEDSTFKPLRVCCRFSAGDKVKINPHALCDSDYTAELDAIKEYLNSIYRNAHEVEIEIEPMWRETRPMYPKRTLGCCPFWCNIC